MYVTVAVPGPGSRELTRAVRRVVPSVGFEPVLISASLTGKDFLIAVRTSGSVIPKRASRKPVTSYLGSSCAFAAKHKIKQNPAAKNTPCRRASARERILTLSIEKRWQPLLAHYLSR